MGLMYFLTSYLQSVLGYSALEAGLRMLPIAAGIIVAAKASVVLTGRLGTKASVASGLFIVAGALALLARLEVDSAFGPIGVALGLMGAGIGLAMAPATEAIMGSLPKAKASIGSAMNDVVREVAGTLGIAVLGSLLAGAYASSMDGATSGLSGEEAHMASDSVGGAHAVAAEVGGSAGAELVTTANQAFVDAMSTTASIAAAIAVVGALIAAAFLPARAAAGPFGPHLADLPQMFEEALDEPGELPPAA
jgi:MFS transporter, DHA2 family, multidrug resistance protein